MLKLVAILRFDRPAACSLKISRICRIGNLAPGIAPTPLVENRGPGDAIRRSPNGAVRSVHRAGRDRLERVVAMVRNGGRDQSVRLVAINRYRWSQSLGARMMDAPQFELLLFGHRTHHQIHA
jgi:hypothetical protein